MVEHMWPFMALHGHRMVEKIGPGMEVPYRCCNIMNPPMAFLLFIQSSISRKLDVGSQEIGGRE
jgi:hypothetical protein